LRAGWAIAGGALVLLAACGSPERAEVPPVADADRIACATGNAPVAPTCAIERIATDAGLELVVRNADGGFHRLLVTRDGRGVIAADGAEAARVTIVDPATIGVAIGPDRYRLPATVGGK
jgi:hypothetical protein